MGKHIDKAGEKIGHLTVIKYCGGSKWSCRCDCGNTVEVTTKYLNKGSNQSCGCMVKPRHEDLSGQRFGRLVAISYVGKCSWLCQCDCGKTKVIRTSSLKDGYTRSCGCIGGHTTHGLSHTKLYEVWCNMKSRCHRKTNSHYKYYGGRGIKVCDEWRDDFKVFYDWAMSNGYDENAKGHELTIDRIDVNGNYEPSNCRWVDASTQCKNRRPYKNPSLNAPVDMVDEDGNVLRSFNSMTEASEATGCRLTSIWCVCNGEYKTSLGYRWRYAGKHLQKKARV